MTDYIGGSELKAAIIDNFVSRLMENMSYHLDDDENLHNPGPLQDRDGDWEISASSRLLDYRWNGPPKCLASALADAEAEMAVLYVEQVREDLTEEVEALPKDERRAFCVKVFVEDLNGPSRQPEDPDQLILPGVVRLEHWETDRSRAAQDWESEYCSYDESWVSWIVRVRYFVENQKIDFYATCDYGPRYERSVRADKFTKHTCAAVEKLMKRMFDNA